MAFSRRLFVAWPLCMVTVVTLMTSIFAAPTKPGPKDDKPGDVMALPDDVIIDALFTNLDTVQDQLEICEEGLRQKLVEPEYEDSEMAHSDFIHNTTNMRTTIAEQRENGSEQQATKSSGVSRDTNELEDDIDDTLDDEERIDSVGVQHKTRVMVTHTERSHGNHELTSRKRRDTGSLVTNETSEEKTAEKESSRSSTVQFVHKQNHHSPQRKQDTQKQHREHQKPHHRRQQTHLLTPTEAVVKRLSGRLEYLKQSLIDCYLLYSSIK